MLKNMRQFVNGSVFGMALIIPGVSATLFAVILKFYDELIFAINHFREDRRKNARHLLVFSLGIAAGSVLFSFLILRLLSQHPFPTMLFFAGLLAGMVPLIAAKAKGVSGMAAPSAAQKTAPKAQKAVLAVFAMIAMIALSRAATVADLPPEYAMRAMNLRLASYVFLAGIINGATLVMPGLSGALILLIMGLYPLVVFSIASIGDLFRGAGNLALLRDIAAVLLPFGIGGLFGCLSMARIMEKLLRDFSEAVYAVILGLLAGSIAALLWAQVWPLGDPARLIIGGAMFCAGCAAAYFLGKRH